MTRPGVTAPDVLALLARLEAAGVRLALNESGDGLRVYGEGRPRPEVMAEVKACKPALLAHLRGEDLPVIEGEAQTVAGRHSLKEAPSPSPVPAELPQIEARPADPAPWEDGPHTVTGPDSVPAGEVVEPADNLPAGHRVTTCDAAEARRPAAPLPDWAAEAAKPGRCGSCARAEDASSEWGRYMVRCLAPDAAWWPMSPPLALHVGAVCGAYLRDGEEVGAGYRSKEAAKTWGNGQARRVPAPAPEQGARL